ncbi:MAG: TIGR02281 family clan AA aspartic protease [Pseudomonadota bacterium]
MGNSTLEQAVYLSILLVGLLGWYVVRRRMNWGRSAQHAAVWVFIFVGMTAAIGLWQDISRPFAASVQGDSITVPRSPDGHYYLTLEVNEVPVRFVVDTGASQIVLTQADAARIGLDPSQLTYVGRAATANGVVETAPVRLDSIALGPVRDTNVPAVVNGGDMFGSLLGMGYLDRWGSVQISSGQMTLTR